MRCFECLRLAQDYRLCLDCGRKLAYCRLHKKSVKCECEGPTQGAASAAVAYVPYVVPSALPNSHVMRHVHLARSVPNGLQEARNRVSVLSFNLQNFTGDHRMGRSNGAIGTPQNQLRARFVAELMRATGANVLLAMETGSDVSAAMEAIRRTAGDRFCTQVSERTHETPQIRLRHSIALRRLDDVRHLRNLLDVFVVTPPPGSRRPVLNSQALYLMCKLRGTSAPTNGRPSVTFCEAWARGAARGDSLLRAGARGLLQWGDIDDADTLVEMVTSLRCLRLAAWDQRQGELVLATECLELLRLIEYLRMAAPLQLDAGLIQRLQRCGPDVARFRYEKNMPLCLFMLMANKSLDISVDQTDSIHANPDARMVYDALAHFGCVEFHYETYGVLLDQEALRMADYNPQHHLSVLRFGVDGRLLGTQEPGSPYNWRSALRMFVPLQGNKWVQMLLFHTRFTVRGEDLAGRPGTVEEQTYRIRAGGVAAIGEAVAGDTLFDIPTLYCGDFNLPVSQESEALSEFTGKMQSLGYTRYPTSLPATTLCSITTLTEEPEGAYSKSYDGAYARGIGAAHIACEVLALAELAKLVDREIIAQLMPIVVNYYNRQVRALIVRLENAFEVLDKMKEIGKSRVWREVMDDSGFLLDPRGLIGRIGPRAAEFGRLSMFAGGDVLGTWLRELDAEIDSVCRKGVRSGLEDRIVLWLMRVSGDLKHAATVLGNLEMSADVRFAVGYQSCISDHLPLLTVLDLDRPVDGPSSAGPSASSSSDAFAEFGPVPTPMSVTFVPANVEEFLSQQGAAAAGIERYRQFLRHNQLSEGWADSDTNVCLLHTLGQHIYRSDSMDAAQKVSRDVDVAPGPMLAIGDGPFPGYLRRIGFTVRLWLLAHDGNVGPPIMIGAAEGVGYVVDVLHYGAHYVPLWPVNRQ